MKIIKKVSDIKRISASLHKEGKRIAFVPTMGYLHDGHLTLVDVARKYGDIVVVSIFVNPTQFGHNEDLSRYPRDTKGDLKKLRLHKADIVFMPENDEVYPADFETYVEVVQMSKPLCGKFRPGHFRGVATIVAKLFNMIKPHYAIFGKKDYQQLLVIKRMVRDLNFDIRIIGVDTIREDDLLAMSSRNSYLSRGERGVATHFAESLYLAERMYRSGKFNKPSDIVKFVKNYLKKYRDIKVQYVELLDAENLTERKDFKRDTVLASAVFIGKTRLIDNRILKKRCP